MLDGKGRKVSVAGQISGRSERLEQSSQNAEMALGRMKHDCIWLCEPFLHDPKGLGWIERTREDLGASCDPDECKQYIPCEADWLGSR